MKKNIFAACGLLALGLLSSAVMFAVHDRFFPPLLKAGENFPVVRLHLVRGDDTALAPSRRAFILYKSTCSHCQGTIHNLVKLYQLHAELAAPPQGVTVELVEIFGDGQRIPRERNVPFSVYKDENGDFMRAMKGSLVPYILLVDKDNIVRYSHTGELSFEQEEKLFREFYQTGHIL